MSPDPDQLAEMARNRGLRLKRSRVRTPDKPGFGMFGLTDPAGKPVFGIRGKRALRASAEEVADYLRGLEKQDWKKSLREAGGTVSRAPKAKPRAAPAPPEARVKKPTPKPREPEAPAKAPPPPVLREARGRDAEQLAGLFALLQHELTPEQVKTQLKALRKAGEPVLLFAVGERVVAACGWHRMAVPHRSRPVGRITVLVVAEDVRNQGLGRRLVEEAERRLAALGCALVEVTSNDRLTRAHAFYRHLGYERTSMRFAKPLQER